MKKLIIALSAVALVSATNAAAFSWKTSMTGKVYQPGTTDLVSGSYTAYLFDVSSVKQETLLTAFGAGTLDFSSYGSLSSATLKNGGIGSTDFSNETGIGGTLTGFFAALIDGKLFISGTVSATGIEGKSSTLQFNAKTASQAAEMLAANGYQGAGWYAIPEPTSGLMILLGMAGLALRRKGA